MNKDDQDASGALVSTASTALTALLLSLGVDPATTLLFARPASDYLARKLVRFFYELPDPPPQVHAANAELLIRTVRESYSEEACAVLAHLVSAYGGRPSSHLKAWCEVLQQMPGDDVQTVAAILAQMQSAALELDLSAPDSHICVVQAFEPNKKHGSGPYLQDNAERSKSDSWFQLSAADAYGHWPQVNHPDVPVMEVRVGPESCVWVIRILLDRYLRPQQTQATGNVVWLTPNTLTSIYQAFMAR